MAAFFFDSSALVKRYVDEQGSARVLDLMALATRLVVSRLALVEVTSAIARRARQYGLPDERIQPVFGALESELRERFEVVELGGSVVARATDLARTYALRAADAIQLACALLARGAPDSDPDFALVSSDAELNAAAAEERLRAIDPARD